MSKLYSMLGGTVDMAIYRSYFGLPTTEDTRELEFRNLPPTLGQLEAVFGHRVFEGLFQRRREAATSTPSAARGRMGMRQAYYFLMTAPSTDLSLAAVWVSSTDFSYEGMRWGDGAYPGVWYPAICIVMTQLGREEVAWWCPRQALDGGYCWLAHPARVVLWAPPPFPDQPSVGPSEANADYRDYDVDESDSNSDSNSDESDSNSEPEPVDVFESVDPWFEWMLSGAYRPEFPGYLYDIYWNSPLEDSDSADSY